MTRRVGVLTGLLVLTLAAWVAAQTMIGGARLYVALVPGSAAQYTLRTDTSVTPNRTEIGCETDIITSTTVNCLRIAGSATGANVTIAAIAATGGDANIGISITPLGTGTVALGGVITSYVANFQAVEFCRSDNANVVVTRIAEGDWALARTVTATGEIYNFHCTIPLLWRTTASKGMRLDSFSIAQTISTGALAAAKFKSLTTVTYANNVANATAAYGGTVTITMPTASQANPYLTAATLATAAFMTTANAAVNIEFEIDGSAQLTPAGIYRLHGISATYSSALY